MTAATDDPPMVDEMRTVTQTSPRAVVPAAHERRTIGRFVVLETLGRGGMGVVFSAYDPALDRKVAIKLLRGDRVFGEETRGRARLVAEAQAMARLSHPHVVAVHEIAFDAGAAFLVMEYVTGPTLRGWLAAAERPWPEVLAMFLGAGQGLVAAHRAGIVHRDFKPENVLIDRDDRARVGDFGLAATIEEDTHVAGTNGVAGTLPYMAPEQLRGDPCDARADQFAYCVALWEALHGARPFAGTTVAELEQAIAAGALCEPVRRPPDWLRGALLRGLQADPAARWPSLEALLGALRRDPRVVRRRIAGAAALAVVVTAAVALWPSAEAVEPCTGARARLAGVWDLARKAQVHAAFAATRQPYADDTWRGVADRLDRYAAGWVEMSGEACRATRVEGRQSDTLLDLRMACLERRRGVLGALTSLWARGVDGEALAHAADATGGLAPLAECADARALGDRTAPPTNPVQANLVSAARSQLDALQAQVLAHRLPDARRAALAARVAVDATRWLPIRAELAVAEGEVLSVLGDPGAEPRLVEATRLADAAADDRLRARALISLVADLADHQQKAEAALGIAAFAEGPVARVDDEVLRGRLLRVRGKALLTAGKYPEARAMLTEARTRLAAAVGAADPQTVGAVADLAQVASIQGDYATALRLDDENLAVAIPALGAEHPQVAQLLTTLGAAQFDSGKPQRSAETYRRALAIDDKVYGDAAPTATTLNNLARAEAELHQFDEWRRHMDRAVAIRERTLAPDNPLIATTLGNLAMGLTREHQYDAAIPALERALAIKLKAYGPAHSKVAGGYDQLALALEAKGDLPRALDVYRRALDTYVGSLGPTHMLSLRAIGHVGHVLGALHRCREARPLLTQAIDGLTKAKLLPAGIADALMALTSCDLEEHQPAQALVHIERVMAITAELHVDAATRGGPRWYLARTLAALGRRGAAIAAARKAAEELVGDPDTVGELAAARAWLAAPDRVPEASLPAPKPEVHRSR